MIRLWPAILLGLSGVAVLMSLCFWQIERLSWKEGLIEGIETAMSGEPMDVSNSAETLENYRPVEVSGRLTGEYYDILSGHPSLGAGVRRVVILVSENERYMVEAGFLPMSRLDDVPPKDQVAVIKGHIYLPETDVGQLDDARNLWIGYDLEKMASTNRAKPLFIVAAQSPIPGWLDQPMGIELPNSHLQYAWTWGLLALVWAIMSAYWGYTVMKRGED